MKRRVRIKPGAGRFYLPAFPDFTLACRTAIIEKSTAEYE